RDSIRENQNSNMRIPNTYRSGTQHVVLAPRRDALLRTRRSRLGSERCELLAAKGRACEPPTALCCLGKYHPGATGLGRVAGDLGHDLGDLFDELLLT